MSAPSRSLTGKTALITGASSGIGEATALALAEAGADVAIGARRADRLQSLAKQLTERRVRVVTIDHDVTDEQDCQGAFAKTLAELGRIDILVNSAGLMLLGPIVGANTEAWRRSMSSNVLGLMYMTHAVVPHLLTQGSGDIVNISSVADRVGRKGAGDEAANKTSKANYAWMRALQAVDVARAICFVVTQPDYVGINEILLRPTAQVQP